MVETLKSLLRKHPECDCSLYEGEDNGEKVLVFTGN